MTQDRQAPALVRCPHSASRGIAATSRALRIARNVLVAAAVAAAGLAALRDARAAEAAIAMPDAYSAAVVEQVLRGGGNAVDAAVAAAFTLAVTFPEGGNLGGGGFMLIREGATAEFLDYRETAPQRAHRDMFVDDHGEPIAGASVVGHRAAAVPGTVAGLAAAHERYGKLPWAALVHPAARLARDGFVVPVPLAARKEAAAALYAGKTNFERYFGGLAAGTTLRQPELAATLERIAAGGAHEFYAGETARLILAEWSAAMD